MASVNKVILIGNLGDDPELRNTSGGNSVCNFSVATNEVWTGKDGKKNERVEWHKIVVWGKQAENCQQYLKKGRPVYVEGRNQTRSWDDKDGVTRYVTEVVARQVVFLSGGSDGGGGGGQRDDAPPTPDDDPIPF